MSENNTLYPCESTSSPSFWSPKENRKVIQERKEKSFLNEELLNLSNRNLPNIQSPFQTTGSEYRSSNGGKRSASQFSFLLSSLEFGCDQRTQQQPKQRASSQMAYMKALSTPLHPPTRTFTNYTKTQSKKMERSPDVLFRRQSLDNVEITSPYSTDISQNRKQNMQQGSESYISTDMSSLTQLRKESNGEESSQSHVNYDNTNNDINNNIASLILSRSGNTPNNQQQSDSNICSNSKNMKSNSSNINDDYFFWLYEKHRVSQSTLGTAATATVVLPETLESALSVLSSPASFETSGIEQRQRAMPLWKTEITPKQRLERAEAARLKKRKNIITVEDFQKLPLWDDIKMKLNALILKGAKRKSEKFGILFDVISTRYIIKKGAPHLVGRLIYEYIEQCRIHQGVSKLKFVFVGITDNINCCAARDVFCLDDVIDGKYVGNLKRPFAAIDGVHMFAVMPPTHLSCYDSFLRFSEPGVKNRAMEMVKLEEQRLRMEKDERKRIEQEAILPPMKIGLYRNTKNITPSRTSTSPVKVHIQKEVKLPEPILT